MAFDDRGAYVPIDDLDQTYTYNADGTIAHITATDNIGITGAVGNSWRKTYTWSSGALVTKSKWVKQ